MPTMKELKWAMERSFRGCSTGDCKAQWQINVLVPYAVVGKGLAGVGMTENTI
jgi:hypothetical protein